MTASSVSFALMAASAKAASELVSSPLVVFARSVVIIVLVGGFMRARGIPFRARRPGLMQLRCLFGTLALQLYYYALSRSDLAEVVVLANTAPLFVPILGIFVLDERPRGLLWVLLAVGFAGVLAITTGSAGTGSSPSATEFDLGLIAATGTGLFAAAAVVCIKRLTDSEHPLTIVVAFAIWCLVSSSPALLYADAGSIAAAWVPLVLTSVFAVLGQVLLTYALAQAPAGNLIIYNYSGVALSFVLGALLWNEDPTVRGVAGAVAIVVACFVATRYSSKLIASMRPESSEAKKPTNPPELSEGRRKTRG